MKRNGLGTYALMVTVTLWGVLLGGVAYSHIVFFPPYLGDLPASAVLVNGPHALHEERFWMVLHPLLIISMIVSLALNWRNRTRRKRIAITAVLYALVIIATSVYFLPELMAFGLSAESSNIPPAEWLARGNRWQYLSWVRGAVLYIGIAPLLFALTATDSPPK